MKVLSVLAGLLVLVLVLPVLSQIPGRAAAPASGPIVVELFTSEGCSSCPPADKLLAELDRQGSVNGRPIIVMGEHVDYWDGLGWKDRFASSVFTKRQTEYVRKLGVDSAYTPQMVVNGATELVGNDAAALSRALAAQKSSGGTNVSLQLDNSSTAAIKVEGARSGSRVLLAVTEGNLITRVQRGENGGRELRHEAVVRRLTDIGAVKSGSFETSVPLKIDSEWQKDKLRLVVLVQGSGGGTIEGAAVQPYDSSSDSILRSPEN
jgi:hypothetical protein